MRDRAWLRSFLSLGARSAVDKVPQADVERQEDTVLQALALLDREPGVVIADEVGMGKTYVALGVAAAMRHTIRNSRIVVVTPGPDLNRKWKNEFGRFSDPKVPLYDFGGEVTAVDSLGELARAAKTHRIVLVPVSVFTSTRGGSDQEYLLSLYFWWRSQFEPVHGHTINAILKRFREGRLERIDVERARFLDAFEFHQVRAHLEDAFRKGRRDEHLGLDDIFRSEGYDGFASEDRVRRALDLARFRLVRGLLPEFDLLIVDEAHKLKNADTLRAQAVATVFRRKYEKTLFLTATPFQLGVEELRQIFNTFALAKNAPEDLPTRVERLFADIADYQAAYDRLYQLWSGLDAVAAGEVDALLAADPELSGPVQNPSLAAVASAVRELQRLKTAKIEPGFRRWMIRSIRDERRQYRRHVPKSLIPKGASALPFLIYERFIAELFREGDGTHKAAVQINMVSSYEAARTGALIDGTDRDIGDGAKAYRNLLRAILQEPSDERSHPKVDFVLSDALAAAERGEKTLIFCARVATLTHLKNELEAMWREKLVARWQRAFPSAMEKDIFDEAGEQPEERHRGLHSRLQLRFHRSSDALHLALRERYLRTWAPVNALVRQRLTEIVGRANEVLREQRVGATVAKRLDWKLAKRCLEFAAAEILQGTLGPRAEDVETALGRLRDPRFVEDGFDLTKDELEGDERGQYRPQWTISEDTAEEVFSDRTHLWDHLAPLLKDVDPELRVAFVERLARYLTFQSVPFLADVVAAAKQSGLDVEEIESRALLPFVDAFWTSEAGAPWLARLTAFIEYFSGRDEQQKRDILDGPIKTGDLVRQTKDGESRERLREAFNTPLHPMVLVANEVMQEGLDLHRACRRVVHHDLAWNPAQLEQRVGRVDRLGSLTAKLREKDSTAQLEVLYPLIRNTIDQRLFRVVKDREKWLEFLLGAPPTFKEYAEDNEGVVELPERLSRSLAISLRPERSA